MNKTQLVEKIAQQADLSKAKAAEALEAFIQTVTDNLAKNEEVSVVGFGTFTVSERAARAGRNPRTGEAIEIKASRLPKFRAGKSLKEAVK